MTKDEINGFYCTTQSGQASWKSALKHTADTRLWEQRSRLETAGEITGASFFISKAEKIQLEISHDIFWPADVNPAAARSRTAKEANSRTSRMNKCAGSLCLCQETSAHLLQEHWRKRHTFLQLSHSKITQSDRWVIIQRETKSTLHFKYSDIRLSVIVTTHTHRYVSTSSLEWSWLHILNSSSSSSLNWRTAETKESTNWFCVPTYNWNYMHFS